MRLGKTRLVRDIVVAIACARISEKEFTLVVSDYMCVSDITLGDASDTTESTLKRLADGDMEIVIRKEHNRMFLTIRPTAGIHPTPAPAAR